MKGTQSASECSEGLVGLAHWCPYTNRVVFKAGVPDNYVDLSGDHKLYDRVEMCLTEDGPWLRILNLQEAARTKKEFSSAPGRFEYKMTKREQSAFPGQRRPGQERVTTEDELKRSERIQTDGWNDILILDPELAKEPHNLYPCNLTSKKKVTEMPTLFENPEEQMSNNGGDGSSGTVNARTASTVSTMSSLNADSLAAHDELHPPIRKKYREKVVDDERPLLYREGKNVYWQSTPNGASKYLGVITGRTKSKRRFVIETPHGDRLKVPKRFIARPILTRGTAVIYTKTGERFTVRYDYTPGSDPEELVKVGNGKENRKIFAESLDFCPNLQRGSD